MILCCALQSLLKQNYSYFLMYVIIYRQSFAYAFLGEQWAFFVQLLRKIQ